ncbi:S-adenosyl-L-methionine-dependent methyltransferase [Mycena sanguinolenta]|uniref:S-adenosyl-L-methionine-dependent methyltransferase n=1 Tax=Mycena sanguinolenta TaxID=230812 RepID=A0A8H6Y3S3_9AGAR|nr:S-adenosyl-L-methionine-dependent methyltransferase [Mycena sanguinolenta]
MHPRNPYRTPPDFCKLAEAYPALTPCIISYSGGFSIDFKNETSQRRLTEALLHRDFEISLNLPLNRLCPPVPNRLNYVLWIQDVIRTTEFLEHTPPVLGLDIGTGASAIYPLLSCRLDSAWSFIATDVDNFSLSCAQSNVEQNGLADRIQVFQTTPEAPIFAPLHQDPDLRADFTMCNPPFYSSREDVVASVDSKEFEPNAVCTGADVEMITEGGEASFVRRMVDESAKIGERCRWYTSMLGKMSSMTEIVGAIREHGIQNYGITEFVQGSTRRWAVVWSFSDFRLSDNVARITNPQLQTLMPPRNTLRQPIQVPAQNVGRLNDILSEVLAAVEGARVVDDNIFSRFIIYANKNTWSRAARRKNKHATPDTPSAEEILAPNLICSMRWIFSETGDAEGIETSLECQWMQGKDRSLFEGFASHISRKVSESVRMSLGREF